MSNQPKDLKPKNPPTPAEIDAAFEKMITRDRQPPSFFSRLFARLSSPAPHYTDELLRSVNQQLEKLALEKPMAEAENTRVHLKKK